MTPSLTFPTLPPAHQSDKDRSLDRKIVWGRSVAVHDVARALLLHGRYDRYYFLCEAAPLLEETRARLRAYPNHQRAEVVLIDDFHRLARTERMVLFSPDPKLETLLALRRVPGRCRWPVVGLTHSLSDQRGLGFFLHTILADIHGHDGLICTSEGGRRVVDAILDHLCARLGERPGGGDFTAPLRRPVIPLGTDAQAFQPRAGGEARALWELPPGEVVFLSFGRFSVHNKMDLAPVVLAYSQLPPEVRARTRLVLAGDDAQFKLAPRLQALAAELGLGDRVRVLANVRSDLKPLLYAAADVFLAPSDSVQETFGLTVIEAMASGLPVIASDWNGYRDTVRHQETGLRVPTWWAERGPFFGDTALLRPPKDVQRQLGQAVAIDLVQLRDQMAALAGDPARRQAMGREARRVALAEYDWPVIVRRYEALFDELLEEASRCDRHQPLAGVESYRYEQVFGHYPTRRYGPDQQVRLSALAAPLLSALARWLPHTELTAGAEPAIRRVAAALAEHPVRTVRELTLALSDDGDPAERALRQVAQLLKYGLLELC